MIDTSLDAYRAFRSYDLVKARQISSCKEPASHQRAALSALSRWLESPEPEKGGIVVLPTGGGKTFTAVRFLCTGPLSKGYKVLWLAHTHHLLEQAIDSFGRASDDDIGSNGCEARWVAEPKATLAVRVVSGTPGHQPVSSIKPSDDVVVITLQTITKAYQTQHPALKAFLDAAGDKLMVVFDEAHHSPAPSYRKMLTDLRRTRNGMSLLGLTATPTYTDERARGWLGALFPQGIIYQVSAQKLMADRILARPIFETCSTDIVPRFDEREYQKWVGTFRDLPEDVISNLAENRERNELIAQTYAANREKYGKAIIFAERWYQCDVLREMLARRGVRADVIYSHVDSRLRTADERNRRHKDENARVLEAFRRDELDVLINVRMLTEGTDVPNVNSVFLTRQTTSQILLTQMIGRALRGPQFGGTDDARIVTFTDNWRQHINFAEYDEIPAGGREDTIPEYGERPPLQLISIEMVRQLARQLDTGSGAAGEFLELMPVGWFRIEFDTLDGDDVVPVRQLLMVFQDQKDAYDALIAALTTTDLTALALEQIDVDAVRPTISTWIDRFFPKGAQGDRDTLAANVLAIARHMGQNGGLAPAFFGFTERDAHDLDAVARGCIDNRLGPLELIDAASAEFHRSDRFWRTIYWNFDQFKSQLDSRINRIALELRAGRTAAPARAAGVVGTPERAPDREPSDDVKRQVKARDNGRCVCCGESRARLLEIDHISPRYYGIDNSLDNLQTLCRVCNQTKGVNELNFRITRNYEITAPSDTFPTLPFPTSDDAVDTAEWEKHIRRVVNFYYRCNAVEEVVIGKRGARYYEWEIRLYAGNDPKWMKKHLHGVLMTAYRSREHLRTPSPTDLGISAPDARSLWVSIESRRVEVV
ncbi:MAG TPA: DEAD/DEAH box helicase family protein [Vicinamibacterales bacterium]|jgi:superfamily II DNA or RNA helicase|nr:DEAD/DEAH box helicase family protein [Vicinamibacterales bacterium]